MKHSYCLHGWWRGWAWGPNRQTSYNSESCGNAEVVSDQLIPPNPIRGIQESLGEVQFEGSAGVTLSLGLGPVL